MYLAAGEPVEGTVGPVLRGLASRVQSRHGLILGLGHRPLERLNSGNIRKATYTTSSAKRCICTGLVFIKLTKNAVPLRFRCGFL